MDTDASNKSVGAVLSQIQNNREVVIAYGSKTLSKTQQNYCTTMRELFAVFHFVTDIYQCYLYGQYFTNRTDHASLVWLRNFKKAEEMLARWIHQLSNYNMDIVLGQPMEMQMQCPGGLQDPAKGQSVQTAPRGRRRPSM